MSQLQVLEGFTILRSIHQGRHTQVLQAIRKSDNLPVVLKLPADAQAGIYEKARINHEFETLKQIKCEGIARIIDRVIIQQTPVLLFEDFEGISLSEFIRSTPIDLRLFLKIGIQLAKALHEVHSRNIMHKDINPNNIVIKPDTHEIRIIDFGISATLSRERSVVVNPNILEGTLAYISPEQTGRMNRSTDYRTDLYSLGITFYEMLVGEPPFTMNDSMELVHCHIARRIPEIQSLRPEIPKVISDIIHKMTSKIADERYQSAEGLKNDLEKCLNTIQEGEISYFKPGLSDNHSRFHIPEKLYGREKEINQILTAFKEASEGQHPFILIGGFSGIGKTALIHELHKPSVERKGFFISGKYNPFARNLPFSGISKAFSELLRQILAESPEKLEEYKYNLREALGPNVGLIAELIPEIEILLGPSPEVQKLNPSEAQNRFFYTFRNFIKVLASEQHPLALFLDDLQWADEASLGLIKDFAITGIPYLLLSGSYRSNEISEGHPLSILIAELKQLEIGEEIQLHPLEELQVRELIQDSLSVTQEQAEPLAALLNRKTGGSPFFINELLKKLFEEKLISYSHESDSWNWDLQQIQSRHISGDVAVFMAGRIAELPDTCCEILKVAACIGNQFELKTLAAQTQLSASEILERLMPAMNAELISPLSEAYRLVTGNEDFKVSFRFQHDRIQQAAYALIEENTRSKLHLEIGRHLLSNISEKEKEERIIEIVQHLNQGYEFIDSASERLSLCKMNLIAGKKAHESVAYNAAFEYFKMGIRLLPDNFWEKEYELAFELHAGLAQDAYLTKQDELAEVLTGELVQRAQSILDKIQILSVRLRQYTTTGKSLEAIKIGLEGLKLLGIKVPANPGPLTVLSEVIAAKWNLGRKKPADLLNAAVMENPEKIVAARLLTEIAPAAYVLGNDNLYGLLTLKVVNLSLKYGNCREAPYAYIAFGMVLKEAFGDLKAAEEFGKMALALNEKFQDIEYKCRVIAAYGVLTHHFNHHWKEMRPWFNKGVESGFQSGDLFYLVHSAGNCLIWDPTLELNEFIRQFPRYLKIIEDSGYKDAYASNLIVNQLKRNFAGKTNSRLTLDEGEFKALDALSIMEERKYYPGIGMYHIFHAELFYFYEAYDKAFFHIQEAEKYVKSLVSLAVLTRFCLLSAIIGIKLASSGKKVATRYWKKNIAQMKKWAEYNPQIFQHLYALMMAEYYSFQGKIQEAAAEYEKAISLAIQGQWLQNACMANIHAGNFYQKNHSIHPAIGYYQEAQKIALEWGAQGIVEYIQEKYKVEPEVKEIPIFNGNYSETSAPLYQSRNTNSTQTFDVATIVQASQAISGEIRLESLLSKMMNIIMVNAGANKGMLLLAQDGELRIQATATGNSVETMQNQLISENSEIPQSLILFVSRIKEPIVLDNASQQGNFTQDPYILSNKTKSVLCSPIVLLNRLYGIIYLENSINTGAFTEDRLKILYLLSAQMAISIQNATLYSNLEQKVEERTAEIQKVNANLNQAYSEIRARNKNIIASITYAKRIQNAILPGEDKVGSVLKNCFVYYQPKDIVSGDFYWFSETPDGWFFAVGDCTGHGVPGAFMTLIANTLLNQIINENEILDPGTILEELDKRLLQTLQQQNQDNIINDGMDISIIRKSGKSILGASAKRPILYFSKNNLNEIKGSKYPIGSILIKEKKFDTFTLPCTSGDMIYLFTDGYVDQFSPQNKKFMIRRFRDLLGAIHQKDINSQKEELKNSFANWKQNQFQLDDVLVAGIRV